MFTITPAEFAKLTEARRLQVERYRTAFFKREGLLPTDTDPNINPQWLRVKLGDLDKCIPVGILTQWAHTFEDGQALQVELNGRMTVRRDSSRLSLWVHPVAHDDKGNAYMGRLPDWRSKAAPLDSPVELIPTPGGSLSVSLPDQSTELATLKAETTAARKQLAKERAIAKARKVEKEKREQLERATSEANEAQAVIDSMTLKQAVSYARKCLSAARSYRAALVAPFPAPAWLPPTFEQTRWDVDTQDDKTETVSTATALRERVSAYQATLDALAQYKPRLSWPSYTASLAREAGMSLAAFKKANPDRAFKTYGPTFDKLKEAKRAAFQALERFLESRCTAYLTANHYREYNRARRLLATWPQRRADLESQVREATQTRERAEA